MPVRFLKCKVQSDQIFEPGRINRTKVDALHGKIMYTTTSNLVLEIFINLIDHEIEAYSHNNIHQLKTKKTSENVKDSNLFFTGI